MTAGILLLNSDYRPIGVLSLKRAVSLLVKDDKVDVIESVPGKKLRSPSVSMGYPSILRLRHYVNVPRKNAVYSRRAIFARDNYTCVYCGAKLSREESTVDHLIPVSECKSRKIRASSFSNCVTACGPCNRRKAARSLEDSGMKFYDPNFIAKTPRTNYLVIGSDFPSEWRKYIDVGKH